MKKNSILFIVILLLVGLGYLFYSKSKSTPLQGFLGKEPALYLYTLQGASTGQLNVSVPFMKASTESYSIHIAIDINNDGVITDDEWQVKDSRAHLVQNLRNNYWFTDTNKKLMVSDEVLLKISFSKTGSASASEIIEKKVKIEGFEIGEKFGFDVAGASEDIKRGIGLPHAIIPVAFADETEVFRNANTPDLAQNRMECAAVSAANSLMSLAGEHDMLGNLPGFTGELIEELKTDMKFKDGISLDNMVAGKNAFTKRRNLPISTELKFAPTKEDIINAIKSGAAVELSFAFVRSSSGRKNNGHVVTLVGASQSNIFVHDSGTPEGMDTLQMFGTVQTPKNTFINVPYPLWDGVAYIDGIVIQNWTTPQHAEESFTDSGEQGSEIEVLVINKQYFPKSFFRIGGHEKCTSTHYHAVNTDDTAYGFKNKTSSEIVSMIDPDHTACGFGKVSEVPVEKITITYEQSQALIKYLPN